MKERREGGETQSPDGDVKPPKRRRLAKDDGSAWRACAGTESPAGRDAAPCRVLPPWQGAHLQPYPEIKLSPFGRQQEGEWDASCPRVLRLCSPLGQPSSQKCPGQSWHPPPTPGDSAHFVRIRAPLFLWAASSTHQNKRLLYWTQRALEKISKRQKVMAGILQEKAAAHPAG